MKYSSRLTALLLALMMIISSAGAELNTSGLTVDQLNHLYEAASEDPVYEYLPADVLGFETALSVDNAADLAASGYTFQWYEILANGAHCEIVGATDYLYPTEYPLEAKQYYCIYTDPDGIAYRSKVFVIAATTTDLDSYLNLLYSLFSDDFGVYDSQKIYEYMTDTWNITLSTGENLAQNVMDYWWSDWSEENRDCDMLCTCVASGKVASDYTILHPNSDAHDPNCYWAKAPIVVSADVSTPDLLKEGQTIVLTSPDAEASYFYWQEYRYNAEANAWEWESVSGGSSYELTVNADSIQAAYRVISNYEDGMYVIPVESRTFFLGGEEFHNWIKTANGILPWLSEDGVTVEQAAAKYSEYLANKDEEDRTNATDYTFTDEDASVNLQVSEDVFAEDYVMEIEAVTPSADVVDAVLKSMDATGTAVMQVLKAFDISFAALEDRTRKLQPSAGQSVTLTFEVSTADVPTDDTYYLYVYHIANDGTPEVVAGPVQVAGSAMTIEVQADGFSTYLVMATNDLCPYCVNHEYCVYYYLNGEERENQYELLITAGAEDNDWFYDTTYDKIMLDYKNHMDAGETPILCTCGRQDENGFIYAPNAAGHANGCLWSIYTLNDVGLCGIPTTILVNNADVLAGGYQITWYRNGDVIVGETDTSLDVTPTMEDVTYQWKATHNDTNEVVMGDPVTVIAQHTVLGEYVEYAFNYRNTNEERYILLTDTWNVDFTTEETNGNVVTTVSKNLAEEIISYWYAKCLADPEGYMYYDVFCDCVVSGKLSSHERLLHPDTGHMTDCPWYVEGNDVIVPEKPDQPDLYYGNPNGAQYTSTETYSLPMADDRAVILPKGGRAIIKSNQASGAQWQVSDGTQWIDIQGETAADIVVTDAKLNAIFELTGIAQLRYFDKTNSIVLASVSVTSQEIAGGEYAEEVTLFAVTREDTTTEGSQKDYDVVVNFVFENNNIVADPYTANLAAGSNFSTVVYFPVVQGYLPYLGNATETSSSLSLNITDIQADMTYTVTYKPTDVNYVVIHYQQNIYDDNYTEVERETLQGLTNSTVPDVANTYAGFYALLYERPAIAADGSTVIEIYYDRNYYLMTFELDGGYGVEPIYTRAGADIGTIPTPTKPGYTFGGWDLIVGGNGDGVADKVYETMPAENVAYKAIWTQEATAKVSIVFWGENADDEGYSYIKTTEVKIKPGTEIHYDGTGLITCGYHTHSSSCTYACGKTEHSHMDTCYTCNSESHTHSKACYGSDVGDESFWGSTGMPNNPSEGQVYKGRVGTYIYIKGTWYNYSGNTASGSTAPTTCGKTEQTHTHSNACIGCGIEAHTHSDACGYSCGKETHTHTSTCYTNVVGQDSSLWTFVSSDTVTVAADGSTVVNVYYDRKSFTLTFRRNNSTVKTITEKWGADIHDEFPIKDGNNTMWWSVPNGATTMKPGTEFGSLDTMPAESLTFTYDSQTQAATLHYMVQVLPGETGVKYGPDDYEFEVYKQINITNSSTVHLTYTEEFHNIIGFRQYWSDPAFTTMGQGGTASPIKTNNYLCYLRNGFDIVYYNPTDLVKTIENVPYETPLNSTTYNWTPTTPPEQYEPGSVRFVGWYLNPECTGDPFDFATAKMPAGPNNANGEVALSLYAKWETVTHKVEFYLDRTAREAGTKLATHPDREVSHGKLIDPRPVPPQNGSYSFVGWFYLEDGEEKALDFANMPINKDLKVYAKWSSNVLKEYTVMFKIQGTDTEIADRITGSALAGTTKTFEAKGNEDLYDSPVNYQEGYFPLVKSHSLKIDINATAENDTNVYTFWYVQKDAVPYTVKYLNAETGEPVAPEKVVSDNRKAVVTETFVKVTGMLPDAYQKRLVVDGTTGAVNEIIFYYTEDTEHAYYKITHYTQNTDKENWTEYSSSEAVGSIGTSYTGIPMTIQGFTYSHIEYYVDSDGDGKAEKVVDGITADGVVLTQAGLDIRLYYTRNSYPYEVRYLEQGTGKELHAPMTDGTGLYGEVVSENAITIENYELVSQISQNITIKIEESQTEAKLNIITFYYVEQEVTISYEVVGPAGCGTVAPTDETVKKVTGTANGSTATASSNTYKFIGWYDNVACEGEALSTDAKYVPKKVNGLNVAATYYAKFELDVSDLTIEKSGMSNGESAIVEVVITPKDGDAEDAQTYTIVFNDNVKSVTISNILIDSTYTVTELDSWSWRYADGIINAGNGRIDAGENLVTITNTRTNTKWLSDESAVENNLGNGTCDELNNQ